MMSIISSMSQDRHQRPHPQRCLRWCLMTKINITQLWPWTIPKIISQQVWTKTRLKVLKKWWETSKAEEENMKKMKSSNKRPRGCTIQPRIGWPQRPMSWRYYLLLCSIASFEFIIAPKNYIQNSSSEKKICHIIPLFFSTITPISILVLYCCDFVHKYFYINSTPLFSSWKINTPSAIVFCTFSATELEIKYIPLIPYHIS